MRPWHVDDLRAVATATSPARVRRHRPVLEEDLDGLTNQAMSYKMLYMRKATISIRELQQNIKQVMARVERGQVIEVTRHRRPIARLAPMPPQGPPSPWPDLEARTRAVFGDRLVTPSVSAMVNADRGDR
jgi:prevent-host-death family protein